MSVGCIAGAAELDGHALRPSEMEVPAPSREVRKRHIIRTL